MTYQRGMRWGIGRGIARGTNRRGMRCPENAISQTMHLHLLRNCTHTIYATAPTPAPKHQQAPRACKSADVILKPHVTVTALAGATS